MIWTCILVISTAICILVIWTAILHFSDLNCHLDISDLNCHLHISDLNCHVHISDLNCHLHISDINCHLHIRDLNCHLHFNNSFPPLLTLLWRKCTRRYSVSGVHILLRTTSPEPLFLIVVPHAQSFWYLHVASPSGPILRLLKCWSWDPNLPKVGFKPFGWIDLYS